MLRLVRALKNSLAPIHRIPPEVFSLIPNHYDTHRSDRDLVRSTHVCRQWREILISSSSLWTRLNLTNVDKTRAFIRRSKDSLLDVYIGDPGHEAYLHRTFTDQGRKKYLDHALSPVFPHIPRLRSLVISADALPDILCHFHRHAPLLEHLEITSFSRHAHILDIALSGGDLSSLRELRLGGVVTHLPWRNMANLKVFNLSCHPGQEIPVTRILDFLESAPLLHTLDIANSIPESSDAPSERTVALRHLTSLIITGGSAHPILKHLNVPVGASLKVWTTFSGEEPPLVDYLPERLPNIEALSHITAVNLCFHPEDKYIQLSGPSGSLNLVCTPWQDQVIPSSSMDHRILHSVGTRILSTTQRLTLSAYLHPDPANFDECPVFHTLSSADDLRTLVLSRCNTRPFVFALDPGKNASKLLLCPNLEEIVLYTWSWDDAEELVSMAETRASMGAKISSITLTTSDTSAPWGEVLKLRNHVTRVEYRANGTSPSWDYLPDENESRVGV